MSIAINQLPVILTSTMTFVLIVILIFMSIKLMQTYRSKVLHMLFLGGLLLAIIQQLFLLINLSERASLPYYITSTTAGMLSFIIFNFVLTKFTIVKGKVKTAPYILFGTIIVFASIVSYFTEQNQVALGYNSYGLPLIELSFLVILIILMTQLKVLQSYFAHFFAIVMLLVQLLAHLFQHYMVDSYSMSLHIIELVTMVSYYFFVLVILFSTVTEKMKSAYMASIQDQMTGLYIRQMFMRRMNKLIKQKPIAMIFCDIDNFKQLNDTKGHLEADQTLIKVANIVKQETGRYGLACRYGGEELVAGIDISQIKAEAVGELIRKRVSEETEVTISIGISTQKDTADLSELLKLADVAMYYSKSTGKNKVTTYKSLPATLKK